MTQRKARKTAQKAMRGVVLSNGYAARVEKVMQAAMLGMRRMSTALHGAYERERAERQTLPEGYTYQTYGQPMTADTIGDMHEKITGRRSEVLDAAEARRKP